MKPDQPESKGQDAESLESIAIKKAHELAAMTDERARELIRSIVAPDGWREQPSDWSGLVEQQALFHKRRPK